MNSEKLGELLAQMQSVWDTYVYCKAHFPYAHESCIGATILPTPPFYQSTGIRLVFQFQDGLTSEQIVRLKGAGHWINQNFVVRLCSLLEYYGVFTNKISIDQSLQGSGKIDILRRLRNEFSHSMGEFHIKNPDHKKLFETLNDRFDLGLDMENESEFSLPIDKVITPLFDGCISYVKAKYSK